MTNRFTKTSTFVQGGIMRPPSDGGLKKVEQKWQSNNTAADNFSDAVLEILCGKKARKAI